MQVGTLNSHGPQKSRRYVAMKSGSGEKDQRLCTLADLPTRDASALAPKTFGYDKGVLGA
jgi:hypothetical protein